MSDELKGIRERGGKYFIEFRIDGERIYSSHDRIEDAIKERKRLEAIRALKATGVDVDVKKHTFKRRPKKQASNEVSIYDAIVKYNEIEVVKKKPATQPQDKRYLKKFYNYMLDIEKLYHISEVDVLHLEQYQQFLSNKLSNATINREFSTLKSLFNKSLKWKFIDENPCKHVSYLTEDSEQRETWSLVEVKKFIALVSENKIDAWAGDVVTCLFTTGLRPGQVASLNFGNFDFESKLLRTKSDKGKRGEYVLPVPNELIELVRSLQEKAKLLFKHTRNSPVFLNSKKNRFTPNSLAKIIRKYRKQVGNDKLTAYGLRHTFGTDLRRLGVELKEISTLMGHKRVSTTERYAHDDSIKLFDIVTDINESRKLK